MIRQVATLQNAPTFRTAVFFAAAMLFGRGAWADVNSCTAQHASGQREARAGHLKVASEQFAACSSDFACPETIRAECTELLAGTTKVMPTVIFSVVDPTGHQLSTVKVFSSDELIAERLDGSPISLDPGKHRFRFVLPSGDVLSSDELIREGEKNRVIAIQAEPRGQPPVSTPTPAAPPPLVAAPPAPPYGYQPPVGETSARRRLPAAFWVATGVGAAAVVSFATFAIMGRTIHAELADCSPTCGRERRGDYDALKRDYLLADISLGVAVVSVGVAAYLYFASPSVRPTRAQLRAPQTLRFGLTPLSSRTGAMVEIANAF